MRRGRKKDLSIPPTRALIQQRDYRARKAHYITELEERVLKAEEENAQLRKELEAARAGLAVPTLLLNPQVAEASHELMQHLSLAMKSLARFQQLTFPEGSPPSAPPSIPLSGLMDQTPKQPPLTSSPHFSDSASPISSQIERHSPAGTAQALSSSIPLPAPYTPRPEQLHSSKGSLDPLHFTLRGDSSKSSSLESECCGGILDCQDLIEEEEEVASDQTQPPERLSDIRSTAERPSYIPENGF